MVSGWLTYAVDSLRNKFKAARQGCQPAESGGAQAETERGEYILSVRLNQAAGFIIYRLKFIFRPGKRRRAAAELPGRISGCIAYRDVCRTGRLAVPGPVLHRDICHTGICAAPGYVLYWDVCSTGARVVLYCFGRKMLFCAGTVGNVFCSFFRRRAADAENFRFDAGL